MVYFSENDINTVKAQRKKAIFGLISIIFIFVLISVGCFLWYKTLPYKSPKIKTIKLVHYPVIVLFIFVMFFYCSLILRRIDKRYFVQKNMINGISETSEGEFIEYSNEMQIKDGVEFKALIFLEWNEYKNDFYERKVLVFYDRDFPEIKTNELLRYKTQSNVLIEYEILEKGKNGKNG